jgi:ubiquinone/menaquinone biosynthesis C-methylase UbiE
MQAANQERNYPLGYTNAEFERLQSQSLFFPNLTQDLLHRAGIASGMHVLDIGSGVGDVSLLAGELVGPSGRVLGMGIGEQRSRKPV